MLLLGGVRPADLAAKNIVPTRVQANSRNGGKPHGRPGWQYDSGLVAVRVQMNKLTTLLINIAALGMVGCQSPGPGAATHLPVRHGTLLLIGGGLDHDNRPVYERFLTLAATKGPARVVIATVATTEQDVEATDKTEALRTWAPGMRFLPWAISDSHFFERDRIGRLVAALEVSGRQLGIGVGEDAAVEVDLNSAKLRGISVSESPLVDAARLQRSGLIRTGIVARLVGQGDSLKPTEWLARTPPPAAAPTGPMREMPIVEPGQNRQLAAWRLFRQARDPESPAIRQQLNGYSLIVFPAGNGNIGLDIRPAD